MIEYADDIDEAEIIDEQLEHPYFDSVLINGERYTDPVSETHRRVENIALGRILIKDFRRFDFEAKNGFQDLSRNEQIKVISNRQKEARYDLRNGSLFPPEKMKLIDKVNEKVDKIYHSFMKWARKKSN